MKVLSKPSPLFSGGYKESESQFFDCTKLLSAQITNLFDFIWPTATAMWNLRWQVQGYLTTRDSTVTVQELHQKFGSDKQIIAPNYYRACVEQSWEEQESQFSTFLLINAFALYESWLSEILRTLGQSSQNLEKQLQYPINPISPSIFDAISVLTANESLMLKDAFYPTFTANKKYCLPELNNLLICYRYFKEVRNSFVHHGGIVSQRLEDASINYEKLTASDLKAKEIPAFVKLRKGDPTKLILRGVVGFIDIILKISTTVDGELLKSKQAEVEFERRWRLNQVLKIILKKKSDYSVRKNLWTCKSL